MASKNNPNQNAPQMFTKSSVSNIEYVNELENPPVVKGQNHGTEPSQFPSISLVERRQNLGNVLHNFNNMSRRSGQLMSSETPQGMRRLEKEHEDVTGYLVRLKESIKSEELESKKSFARAVGIHLMIEVNPAQEKDIKRDVAKMYGDFVMQYADSKGYKSRLKLKRTLRKQEEVQSQIQSNPEAMLKFPTATGLISLTNPLIVNKTDTEDKGSQTDTLNTPERIEAIEKDPSAGFMPSTNLEKNIVLTFLDYLDNPKYPNGIKDQIIEVVQAHNKANPGAKGLEEGRRAAKSITHVIGDFYNQANYDKQALIDLNNELAGIFPNLTLSEEISADNPGFVRLVRHIDQKEFLEHGEVKPVDLPTKKGTNLKRVLDRMPFRTERNENIEDYFDKNKIPEDPYTRSDRTKAFDKWLEVRLKSLKVGNVRQIIAEAIDNQEKRTEFHRSRLEELAEYDTSLPRALKLASGIASHYLKEDK